MNYKILLVDDEPANLRLLERLFRADYQVITASSGIEALELLGQFDVEVIISDQRMPGMTGIEFLKRAAEMRQHTVRIILTGYTDVGALVEAINSGVVYKYVSKPWSNEDLRQTVVRALEHYETTRRQHELKLHNERLTARVRASELGFARLIAETLDLRDAHAHNHARRTAGYARAVGHRLELEGDELEALELAAYLHEAGRIGVPDELLRKNESELSADERAVVNRCAERGWQVLGALPEWSEIALAVRHHAEHFDGGGSPDNLSGEQIPLPSRIVAVACAYDKMISPPDFEPALRHDEAVENLRARSGKQFDAQVVEAFCALTAIGKIRRAVAENPIAMRLLPARVFIDAKTLPTAELLQKFKTEPLLAFDMLKLVNAESIDDGEKEKKTTAALMAAMSRLGETKLRGLLEQNGLPAADARFDVWCERSVRRAVAAQMLAAHTDIIEPEEAYALGLLYDVGEVLLAFLFPEETGALALFEDEELVVRQIETFGVDAIEVSRWMLAACGLRGAAVEAVKAHRRLMHINNPATLLLHAAHKIAGRREPPKVAGDVIGIDCFSILRLTRADLFQIHERANAVGDNRIEALQEA